MCQIFLLLLPRTKIYTIDLRYGIFLNKIHMEISVATMYLGFVQKSRKICTTKFQRTSSRSWPCFSSLARDISTDCVAYTIEMHCSQLRRLQVQDQGASVVRLGWEFPSHCTQHTSRCFLTWWTEGKEPSSGSLLYIRGFHPHDQIIPPKSHFLIPSQLRLGYEPMNWVGERQKHSAHNSSFKGTGAWLGNCT